MTRGRGNGRAAKRRLPRGDEQHKSQSTPLKPHFCSHLGPSVTVPGPLLASHLLYSHHLLLCPIQESFLAAPSFTLSTKATAPPQRPGLMEKRTSDRKADVARPVVLGVQQVAFQI